MLRPSCSKLVFFQKLIPSLENLGDKKLEWEEKESVLVLAAVLLLLIEIRKKKTCGQIWPIDKSESFIYIESKEKVKIVSVID